MAMAIIMTLGLVSAPGAFGYQEVAVSDGGTITGKVSFKGEVPEPQHFQVSVDPNVCGKEQDFTFVRVNGDALQNVVVVLEGVKQGKPFATQSTELVAKNCVYLPYVMIASEKDAVGPAFTIENTDTVTHIYHAYEVVRAARRHLAAVALPGKASGLLDKLEVRKGNVIKIECDLHNFMHSWARVVENPYFAEVRKDGSFKIDDIPPGRYKLVAWHPILGEQTQEVNIASKGMAKADFTFAR
jgi:hypothetical protein